MKRFLRMILVSVLQPFGTKFQLWPYSVLLSFWWSLNGLGFLWALATEWKQAGSSWLKDMGKSKWVGFFKCNFQYVSRS